MTRSKKILIIGIVILLQLAVISLVIHRKQAFYIDELWSFNLANSYFYPVLYGIEPNWLNTWLDPKAFADLLVVSPDHRFAFDSVWSNQAADVHPPLYYAVLHFLCSCFPGQWGKWLGLLPNLVCFIITQIVLFGIAERMSPVKAKVWFALSVIFFYGFTYGAICSATIVRMYMMLTMFVTVSLALNLIIIDKALRQGDISKECVWLAGLYLSGFLTQYLFVVPMFFCSGATLLIIYVTKGGKAAALYAGLTSLGILGGFVLFPATWEHLIGVSYRGAQARELILDAPILDRLYVFGKILNENTGFKFFLAAVLCFIAVLMVKTFCSIKFVRTPEGQGYFRFDSRMPPVRLGWDLRAAQMSLLVIVFTSVASMFVMSRITEIVDSRYIMPLFPAIVAASVGLVWLICRKLRFPVLLICFVVVSLLVVHWVRVIPSHDFKWSMNNLKPVLTLLDGQSFEEIPDRTVCIIKDKNWWPLWQHAEVFTKSRKNYILEESVIEKMPISGHSNLVIINRFVDEDKVVEKIKNEFPDALIKRVAVDWHGNYFLVRM